MMLLLLVLVVLVVVGNGSQFYIKDNKIYDKDGGIRIFHGVNLVEKSPPYYVTSFG